MKYRILENENGKFKIQYKQLLPWWTTYEQYYDHGMCCDTLEQAQSRVQYLIRSRKWKQVWP